MNRKDKWTSKVHKLTLLLDSGIIIFFTMYFLFGQVDHQLREISICFTSVRTLVHHICFLSHYGLQFKPSTISLSNHMYFIACKLLRNSHPTKGSISCCSLSNFIIPNNRIRRMLHYINI